MKTLAGVICIRNGNSLDYCWQQAAKSLLGVCGELVLCDSDSEDGTRGEIDRWAASNKKINVCSFPWTNPAANPNWYPEFLNYARQHAQSKMCLYLDGDEVLHEQDYPAIRNAASQGSTLFFKRFNFWANAQSLIPEGVCCGTKVLRLAPFNCPVPSDYPYEPADATVKQAVQSKIRVFHYGFLRKREAFFAKARVVQKIWVGHLDPRLEAAEKDPQPWMTNPVTVEWNNRLVPYTGSHPKVIHSWLKDRGYVV